MLSERSLRYMTRVVDIVKSPLTGENYEWTTTGSEQTIIGLPLGNYILKEVTLPPDLTVYQAADISFSINKYGELIVNNNTVTNKTITMTDNYNKITVNKKDQYNANVNGAILSLYKSSDLIADKTVTAGSVVFTNLERGATYTIKETFTPFGYVKANDITFTMGDDGKYNTGTVSLNNPAIAGLSDIYKNKANGDAKSFNMFDELILGHASFIKKDSNDKAFANAEFDLYMINPALATGVIKVNSKSLTSSISGLVTTNVTDNNNFNNITSKKLSDGLTVGTYYFIETSIPTHGDYVLPDSAIRINEFTITEANRYSPVTNPANYINPLADCLNVPLNCHTVIRKIDSVSNLPLIGVVFELKQGATLIATATTQPINTVIPYTDSNGNPGTYTTLTDGEAVFTNVYKGSYIITEKTAPAGYIRSTAVYDLTVTNSSKDKIYYITDTGISETPGTLKNVKISLTVNKKGPTGDDSYTRR